MRSNPICSQKVKVRYAETDQMGVAHHATFLVWFEIGRTEYCRSCGIPYAELEGDEFLLRVVRVECRYRAPIFYDQEARIDTWVERLRSRSILFGYRITRLTDEVCIAEGHSLHICTNRQGDPRALPLSARARLLPQAS